MLKRKKKLTEKLTPEAVCAWAEGISGAKVHQSAARFGVSTDTISRWRRTVQQFVESGDIDPSFYRKGLFGFFDIAADSVRKNLLKADVTMTIAYLKGLQIFTDKLDIAQQQSIGLDATTLAARLTELGVLVTVPPAAIIGDRPPTGRETALLEVSDGNSDSTVSN